MLNKYCCHCTRPTKIWLKYLWLEGSRFNVCRQNTTADIFKILKVWINHYNKRKFGAQKEELQIIVLVLPLALEVEGENQYVDPYIKRKNWNLRHKTEESINFLTEEAKFPSDYICINIREHGRCHFHSNEKLRMRRDPWLITMGGYQFSNQQS